MNSIMHQLQLFINIVSDTVIILSTQLFNILYTLFSFLFFLPTQQNCIISNSGNSPDHCSSGTPPTPPPVAPSPTTAPAPPTPTPIREDDSRLIAYLGNWQSCPTTAEVSKYTHIVIAFAVSYTWNPSKNVCSSTCDIAEPPICNNSPNPGLVSEWQAAGKKVILSFGGKSFSCYVSNFLLFILQSQKQSFTTHIILDYK